MVGPWFTTPWRLIFQNTRGCCLALSALFPLFCCVRNPAMSLSPLPHPLTDPVPTPHHSSRVYTPLGRQQPYGASPLDPYPSRDGFVHLARIAPILPHCVCVVCFSDSLGTLRGPCHTVFLAPFQYPIPLPAPIPHRAACIPCVYPTWPHATLWRLPEGPFLASYIGCSYPYSRCLLARCCVSSGCVWIFSGGVFLLCAPRWPPPPPFPSVCPCPVPWFPAASVFFLT